MEIHLMINDVVGMDEQKRHILRVDSESLTSALMEHPGWVEQQLVKDLLMKRPKLMSEIINDPDVRNTIYMQEKAKRDAKGEKRERHRLFEIERQRRQDQHKASIATRKALDFLHDVLGGGG